MLQNLHAKSATRGAQLVLKQHLREVNTDIYGDRAHQREYANTGVQL